MTLPPTGWRPRRGRWTRVPCPICGQSVPLTPLGVLRAHAPGDDANAQTVNYMGRPYCWASWRAPEMCGPDHQMVPPVAP